MLTPSKPANAPLEEREMKPAILIAAVSAIIAVISLASSTTPAEAANCGGVNQRPCTIFERIPSCNKGLVENFAKGRCVRPARPGLDCGRKNQRPCTIVERIPSCNKGLIEDFVQGRCVQPARAGIDCGNANQRPCTILERIPSCNAGLVEDFLKGQCVPGAHHAEFQTANAKLAEIGDLIAAQLGLATRTANDPTIQRALQTENQAALGRAAQNHAPDAPLRSGKDIFRTMTVGASIGGKFIVGGSAGIGSTIDLTKRLPTYPYATADYEVGLGFGVGGGADIGFWVCQANKLGGPSWGIEFSVADIVKFGKVLKGLTKFKEAIKPGFDIGIALWFEYGQAPHKFLGFTITPSFGGGLDTGGYVKATTAQLNDDSVECDGTPKGSTPIRVLQPGQIYIQTINAGAASIRHTKAPGASRPGRTRICLRNNTRTQKTLTHRIQGTNPLRAAPNGGQSCANFSSSTRLHFAFVDGVLPVKTDFMSLGTYDGDIVTFTWER